MELNLHKMTEPLRGLSSPPFSSVPLLGACPNVADVLRRRVSWLKNSSRVEIHDDDDDNDDVEIEMCD
jgi:hypothetical protein